MELIMKKTSRILALLLSLVAVFSLFGCGSKDADGDSSDDNTVYTISWAHSSSTNDRLALATEKMAAELEEASGGRLKIEHYPASQLGAEREILEGVALGTIDCGIISSGVVAGFSNSVYVTNMPYLIDDREIGWKVYDGEFGQMLGKKTEEEGGWKFLGWCDNSLRMFSNTKREIQTPADMVGLKIRTQENDIHMAIVNSLGASATPVAFSELYGDHSFYLHLHPDPFPAHQRAQLQSHSVRCGHGDEPDARSDYASARHQPLRCPGC